MQQNKQSDILIFARIMNDIYWCYKVALSKLEQNKTAQTANALHANLDDNSLLAGLKGYP
jgi:hypothetical protein